MAVLALTAANPELRDDVEDITVSAAEGPLDVVDTARALGALVNRYRITLGRRDVTPPKGCLSNSRRDGASTKWRVHTRPEETGVS